MAAYRSSINTASYPVYGNSSLLHILLFVLLLFLIHLLFLLCQNHPVILIIILVSTLVKELFEHCSHLRVVWTLIKS